MWNGDSALDAISIETWLTDGSKHTYQVHTFKVHIHKYVLKSRRPPFLSVCLSLNLKKKKKYNTRPDLQIKKPVQRSDNKFSPSFSVRLWLCSARPPLLPSLTSINLPEYLHKAFDFPPPSLPPLLRIFRSYGAPSSREMLAGTAASVEQLQHALPSGRGAKQHAGDVL